MHKCEIIFLFLGGEHHFLHIAPVAAALSRRDDVRITAYVKDDAEAGVLRALLTRLGSAGCEVVTLSLPPLFDAIGKLVPAWSSMKVPRTLWWNRTLLRGDILVTAEQTSSLLTQMPGRKPLFVYIPHGAGDRAKGFEPRQKRFDHILTAGEKTRERTIAERLQPPERVSVAGPIKLSALRQLNPEPPRLFDNDRTTVLYNPHFDQTLASWESQGRALIEAIAGNLRYNLIVAPHTRLFENASPTDKAPWLALARPDTVLIDLGSERSSDMTYTRAADIYIGDVSSQIYEFLATPRPCIFINAHAVTWQGDSNYRMWELGEVVQGSGEIVQALDHAQELHADYAIRQQDTVRETLGDLSFDAAQRAADIIIDLMESRIKPSPR